MRSGSRGRDRKVLVSASWMTELRRLQKVEEEKDMLEKKVVEMKAGLADYDSLKATLQKFHKEYLEMKEQLKEETNLADEAVRKRTEMARALKEEQLKASLFSRNIKRLESELKVARLDLHSAERNVRTLQSKEKKLRREKKEQMVLRDKALDELQKESKTVNRERAQRLEDLHKADKVMDQLLVVNEKLKKSEVALTRNVLDAKRKKNENTAMLHAISANNAMFQEFENEILVREEETAKKDLRIKAMETELRSLRVELRNKEYFSTSLQKAYDKLQKIAMQLAENASTRDAVLRTFPGDSVPPGGVGNDLRCSDSPISFLGAADQGEEIVEGVRLRRATANEPRSRSETFGSLVRKNVVGSVRKIIQANEEKRSRGFRSSEHRFPSNAHEIPSTVLLSHYGSTTMPPNVSSKPPVLSKAHNIVGSHLGKAGTGDLHDNSFLAFSRSAALQQSKNPSLRRAMDKSRGRTDASPSRSTNISMSTSPASRKYRKKRIDDIDRVGSVFLGSGLGYKKQLPSIKSPGSAKQVIKRILADLEGKTE